MMLGFLLARAGIDVYVLEKHTDFLRDFRGDTVHPSTLEVMHELGLLEPFLQRPHQEVRELGGQIGDEQVMIADFSHLPTRAHFIAMMPQWEFLNFLAEQGRPYPTFHLLMESEVMHLLEEDSRIIGATANTPNGPITIRADLIVGADGRHSIVREQAGLIVDTFGVPIDVLWMRLSKQPADPTQTLGYLRNGHVLVMLDRGEYWQCGFVIPKGGYDNLRRRGIESFRDTVAAIAPFTCGRLDELRDWSEIKLLTVLIDRLRRWHRPGLLCIGDAAHAMSPIGGVGINLAIQDAVAAANILAGSLTRGAPTDDDLHRVQRRREFPTRMTQHLQVFIQNRVISRVLAGGVTSLPFAARLLRDWPMLRRIPARFVGLGFRPEHVKTADVFARGRSC